MKLIRNRGHKPGLADGIVITPSHNPPDENIQAILTQAPGNGAPLGGLKVIAENGTGDRRGRACDTIP